MAWQMILFIHHSFAQTMLKTPLSSLAELACEGIFFLVGNFSKKFISFSTRPEVFEQLQTITN
jgi:hypothetical protein